MNHVENLEGRTDPGSFSELGQRECREMVNRMVSSATFKNSPRLRQFLGYIAERSLTGRTEEIKEHEIGRLVFGRGENYDTLEDSVVRSSARQLRAKVKEYFDSEGRDEKWHLAIPKGHYEVIFTLHQMEPATSMPDFPGDTVPASRVRRWQIIAGALVVVAIALGIGSYRIWLELQRALQVKRPSTGLTLASTLLSKDEPTKLVISDYGSTLMAVVTHHPFSVEEYANRMYSSSLLKRATESPLREMWDGLSNGHAAFFPDAAIAGDILRLSGEEGKRVVMQSARQTTMQDFQAGNLILVSSPNGNPWINLVVDKLNFRYHVKVYADRPHTEFLNLDPRPGEKSSYSADLATPGYGTTYGLVARVPNLTGKGKILIIHGLRYTGSQAAGDFVTDPRAAAELLQLFKVKSIGELPDFEILLKTESLTNSHFNTKIVAFRRGA